MDEVLGTRQAGDPLDRDKAKGAGGGEPYLTSTILRLDNCNPINACVGIDILGNVRGNTTGKLINPYVGNRPIGITVRFCGCRWKEPLRPGIGIGGLRVAVL